MRDGDNHLHLAIVPKAEADGLKAEERPAGNSLMLVGDLAKATGKTVRAIHLYEELGLVRAHERSKGRYRLFTAEALLRVRWISKLQSLGLSLTDIQKLVEAQEGTPSAQYAAAKLRDVYVAKLADTRAKLAELAELETELEQSLAFLTACSSVCESEVSTHSCPTCERHHEPQDPPDLIAGIRAQ
ncbi:MAG TPA: MerR family transcriptional regulator [Polyangiaceae bacterium]